MKKYTQPLSQINLTEAEYDHIDEVLSKRCKQVIGEVGFSVRSQVRKIEGSSPSDLTVRVEVRCPYTLTVK